MAAGIRCCGCRLDCPDRCIDQRQLDGAANVTASDNSAAGTDARNVWNVVILVLVGAAIVSGFVMTQVAVEPIRSGSFWLLMLIGGAMIVSAVGWGYTEIRIQERLSANYERASDARRIFGYVGVLIVVAAIAVAGSMAPARLAPPFGRSTSRSGCSEDGGFAGGETAGSQAGAPLKRQPGD